MPEIVRAALVQSAWTGDKASMTEANVELAREAAAQGAQVTCLQELFYGPYFCQVQDASYFSYAETVPGGPTTELMCSLARELGTVMVVPVFEEEQPGVYYNT
ncbi:MAG: nitrilase-related carbon-nitrogen hydrolase, partial [Acidimicrobiales bacterium]